MEYTTVVDFCLSFDETSFKEIGNKLEKLKELIIQKYDIYGFQLLINDEVIEGKDCGVHFQKFIDYVLMNVKRGEDDLIMLPSDNQYLYNDRPELDCIAHFDEGDMEFEQSFSLNEDGVQVFVNINGWYTSELDTGFISYVNIYHMIIDVDGDYNEFSPEEYATEEEDESDSSWIVNELDDSAFSSSSDWNRNHSAKFARFDSKPKFANWSAKKNELGEWIQLDLGEEKKIKSVRIQGRHNYPQWVTKYNLWVGNDLSNWTKFEDITGTSGQDESSEFTFPELIQGQYLRFLPTEWVDHISMRVDVCTVLGELNGNQQLAEISEWEPEEQKILIDQKRQILEDPINIIAFIYVCVAGVDGSIIDEEDSVLKIKLSEWQEDASENLKLAKEFWKSVDGPMEKEVLVEAVQILKRNLPEESLKSFISDLFSIIEADSKIEDSEKGIVGFIINLLED